MRLDDVILLAAHTARSQAYLQTMLAAGMAPAQVVLLGAAPCASQASALPVSWQGMRLPDLSEPLSVTCQRAGIEIVQCDDDVNGEDVAAVICATKPAIVIYSGRGGQLVAARTLALGPRFLHMHSGWLPDYRGSTTVYYALLDGQQPAVTALFLDAQIDTGPVLAREHYPRPPAGMDIDRVYDSAIRADLLVKTLQARARTGAMPAAITQDVTAGRNHYVIHPVLKHLAILSLGGSP